jgi:hypothetical protein
LKLQRVVLFVKELLMRAFSLFPMLRTSLFCAFALAACAGGGFARASVIPFVTGPTSTDFRTDAIQAGFGFYLPTNNTPTINELGFWVAPQDSGNTGVLAVSHKVALAHYIGGSSYAIIAEATIGAGSTGDANQYAWARIAPVTLTDHTQGGAYYILLAQEGTDKWVPNSTPPAGLTDVSPTFGTLTGGGEYTSNALPGVGGTISITNQPVTQYGGPNMGVLAVPEPASAALLGVGSVTVGVLEFIRRRRRRHA